MAYIYSQASKLKGQPVVGSHQCVALVQHYAGAPTTAHWRQGEAVFGNAVLRPGTAIATFVKGRYPNRSHGNHAALYVGKRQTASILPINGRQLKKPRFQYEKSPLKARTKRAILFKPATMQMLFLS